MNTLEKIIAGICIFVFLCVIAYQAVAGGSHHIVNTPVIETTETTVINYNIDGVNDGIAMAISNSQIDCNHSTQRWQGGVGMGFYDSKTAISGGICKRFKDTLIKATFGTEEGNLGGGMGIMWQFN